MFNICCLYGNDHDVLGTSPEVEALRKKAAIAKTCAFALGLLLLIGAIVFYTQHWNGIAAHSLLGAGLASFVGSILATLIHCRYLQGKVNAHHAQQSREEAAQKAEDDRREQSEIEVHNAAKSGSVELLKRLAEKGGHFSGATHGPLIYGSPLHHAAACLEPGALECMRIIIEKAPTLVSSKSSDGTPLAAVLFGITPQKMTPELSQQMRAKIELLLKHGAHANEGLKTAVIRLNAEFLKFLIERGGDVTQVEGLLHKAVYWSAECMKIILEKAPQLAIQPFDGRTPLQYAQKLVKFGFTDGALENWRTKIALLIDNGADVNQALGIVAFLGDLENLQKCLAQGADLTAIHQLGEYGRIEGTALQLAEMGRYSGSQACAQAIREHK